jgi:outer membrane protein
VKAVSAACVLALLGPLSGRLPADQDPAAPTVSLTLEGAKALALQNHPQVVAARGEAAIAHEEMRIARSAYMPTVNLYGTGSVANEPSRIGAGFLTASSLFNRVGTGVTLSQLVTDLGRTSNIVAGSRLQAEASQKTYEATRADVLLGVTQAYFEVLRAQGLRKVADDTVKAREVLNDQVGTLARNKLRSQLDVSFTEVALSEAKLMVIRAGDQLGAAFAQLSRALGTAETTEYLLEEAPLPPAPPPGAGNLIAEALKNRPELAGVRFQDEAAHHFEQAEKDLSLPSVVLLGVAGYIPYIEQTGSTKIPDWYGSAALNVQIPVFNGHLFSARHAAALEEARVADQRTRDLEQRVVRDVRVAWGDAQTAYERMDVTTHLLQQASLGLELAQGRYELGLASIVELTQAQLNLTQAEVENLTARYDYASQYALLQYAVGALQ